MTTYGATIVDSDGNPPAYGDDAEIVRTITGLVASQTISKAWFTVKNKFADLDADAVLQIEIDDTPELWGQVTDEGSGETTGEITFIVTGASYDDLRPVQVYVYDIQILLSDGVINTVERGTVYWPRQVTVTRA